MWEYRVLVVPLGSLAAGAGRVALTENANEGFRVVAVLSGTVNGSVVVLLERPKPIKA